MKNNIDFYQHYANSDQHPKFKMLRVVMGWAGEGKFWALNNRIAQSENCCLDVSKKYNKAAIASDLDFTFEEFEKFIDFLLNDCELVKECSPGVITTDIIQENFQRVDINREKARERKQRYLEKVSKGSGELPKSSTDQNNKVKESKVKESKVNLRENLFKKISIKKLDDHSDIIMEFFDYRVEIKKPYKTDRGLDGLLKDIGDCKNAGMNIKDCLETAMQREWQTPSLKYFNESKNNHAKKLTMAQRAF